MRRTRLCRLAVLPTASLAVLLSPCAQTQHSYQTQSYAGAYSAHQQVAVIAPSRVVIEDDGMPAQHPPRLRRGAVPDDPSEPFSPNYGSPSRTAPVKKLSKDGHAT